MASEPTSRLPNLRACVREVCCGDGEGGTLKATVLDTLSLQRTWMAAGAFFFCLIITLIIGGTGPAVASNSVWLASAPTDTTLTYAISLSGLNKWQQATWLVASLQRPVVSEGGPYLLAAQPLTIPLTWTLVSVTADGSQTLVNSSHVINVDCPPRQSLCRGFALFSQALTTVSRYDLVVQTSNPFAGLGVPAQAVIFSLSQGTVNEAYTQFEAGFKVFYCVITCLLYLYYLYCLRRGEGTHDSEGSPLSSTHEQKWLLYLGFFLFFFNDPNFITYLAYPTAAGAGFSAFCAATFVALLLFFFLCLVDNARQGGDAGFQYHHTRELRVKGACFWVPKVLICSVIWATSLALYVFQRLSNLQDPSFTFADTFGQFYMSVLTNFVLGIGIIYILYFLGLIILAYRAFRTASPSSRFLLVLSTVTLLLVLVGLFTQGFVATRSTAIVFLAAYGIPTIYVWALLLLLRPAPHPPSWTANTLGAFASSSSSQGEVPAPPAPATLALTAESWGGLDAGGQWEAFKALQLYVLASVEGAAARAAKGEGSSSSSSGSGSSSSSSSSGGVGGGSAFAVMESGQGKEEGSAPLPNQPMEAEEVEVGVEGGQQQQGNKWT